MLQETCEKVLGRRKAQHEWISRISPTDRQATDGHEREPSQSNRRKLERWIEHFRELLNRPTPETSPDTQPSDTDLPIDCNF